MANYGAITIGEGVAREAQHTHARRRLRIALALVLLVVGVVLLATVGVSRVNVPAVLALIPTSSPSTLSPASEEDVNVSEGEASEPTAATFATMLNEELNVLVYLGISPASIPDTDLDEACGAFRTPCVASVGACLIHFSVVGPDGKVTADQEQCNCYAQSSIDSISVYGNPFVGVHCDYTCLESINGVFNQYLAAKNGPSGARKNCDLTFSNMADKQFGSDHDVVAQPADLDSLTVMELDNPKVVRAGEVLQEYINEERTKHCPLMNKVSAAAVTYARVGMVDDARFAYHIETVFESEDQWTAFLREAGQKGSEAQTESGAEEFVATIQHLPQKDQLADPSNANIDPNNFLGRFAVVDIKPDPCAIGAAAKLVNTAAKVQSINAQELSWKAAHRPEHRGRTAAAYAMGLVKPQLSALQGKRISLSTAGFTPPKEYRASDQRGGKNKCSAYEILDQGGCGSCYAFASATAYSARMCRKTDTKWNIVASPQEMIDCSNGCDGGWPLSLYESIADQKSSVVVESFCDPYLQKKETCGGYCATGNTYSGVKHTAVIVGDNTADGVKQMQLELMTNGPGTVAFEVYDDFYSYTSGVYTVSKNAQKRGGHAVTLIGWGEEGGVPYWLIQNSWGADSGDKGLWKIRRGSNEADIETYGLTVVVPEVPAYCPNLACKNGAIMLKDCTCKCRGGWSGTSCDSCSLSCKNGGVIADDCSKCMCPQGYSGLDCGSGVSVTPLAGCAGAAAEVKATWAFGAGSKAPTQKSILGVYTKSETGTFKMSATAYLCGTTYDKTKSGGLCPDTGSVVLSNKLPATGEYKIALVEYQPPNEFGQDGYATTLTDLNTVAFVSVLASGTSCSAQAVAAASQLNAPASVLAAQLAAVKAKAAAEQAAADARLDIVEPLLAELSGAPSGSAAVTAAPAEIKVSGISAADPVVWGSAPSVQLCFTIPSAQNVNPKAVVLYEGDGSSGSFFPTGILKAGFDNPLPSAADGCVTTSFSPGLPAGMYTIKLQKQWTPVFATTSFYLANAKVDFTKMAYTKKKLSLTIDWSVSQAKANVKDVVKVFNSKGSVVYWFYTSAKSGKPQIAGTKASMKGTLKIDISSTAAVKGGYDMGFYPAGGEFEAANAPDWIDWKKIGW